MDIYSILANIPWVSTHPWMTALVIPALFWAANHIMTQISAPISGKSNPIWVAIYPFLNVFIAANYGKSKNALENVISTNNIPIKANT